MASSMRLTEGRIRLLRLGGAVMDGGREMLQDAFRFHMEQRMQDPWNDGQLFRRWCVANADFVGKYKFLKSSPKEVVEGVEVPKWEDADVTLLSTDGEREIERERD